MNFLICPDSFKESLTSAEVTRIITKAINDTLVNSNITTIAMADGGEGSLEALEQILKAQRVYVNTYDAIGRKIKAYYLTTTEEVYIEMANSVGLALVEEDKRDILKSSSRGLGVIIKDALKKPQKKINIFIGGSATNDAGIGAMSELGVKYYDANGEEILNIKAEDLSRISSIDKSALEVFTSDKEFVMLSDVFNPLIGDNGATRVYSKQKGASEAETEFLEEAMLSYASILEGSFFKDVLSVKSCGAAGGMGSALIGYLNAETKMGSEFFLDINEFDKKLKEADVIISGEGKYDNQSSMGKVLSAIVSRAEEKKVVVFCGLDESDKKESNIDVVSIKPDNYTVSRAINEAEELLYSAACKYLKGEM